MSVAWSTLEWICRQVRARTLFATHYHELTRLAASLPGAANAHMAVEASRRASDEASPRGSLRFLYELRDGAANESFGIHVARLAGLPPAVVERAWSVLEELERSGARPPEAESSTQLSLFAPPATPAPHSSAGTPTPALAVAAAPAPAEPHPVLVEIGETDFNRLTPLQALNLLVRLQESARATSRA